MRRASSRVSRSVAERRGKRLRQLGDVGGDAPRLVAREHFSRPIVGSIESPQNQR
jgi:hypothetical protein